MLKKHPKNINWALSDNYSDEHHRSTRSYA